MFCMKRIARANFACLTSACWIADNHPSKADAKRPADSRVSDRWVMTSLCLCSLASACSVWSQSFQERQARDIVVLLMRAKQISTMRRACFCFFTLVCHPTNAEAVARFCNVLTNF